MSEVLTIVRDEAVELCVAMGHGRERAEKWNAKRLRKRLDDLADMVRDDDAEVPDEADLSDEERKELNALLRSVVESRNDDTQSYEYRLVQERLEEPTTEDEPEPEPEPDDEPEVEPEPEKPKRRTRKPKRKAPETSQDEPEPKGDDPLPEKPKAGRSESGDADEVGKPKRKTKKSVGPSTKGKVYALYLESEDKSPKNVAKMFHEAVDGVVKLTTISGWISMWNNGKGLPACAKEDK